MRQRRRGLLQLVFSWVLLVHAHTRADQIPSHDVTPIIEVADDITRPLEPAAERDCGADAQARIAGQNLKGCPAFARDPALGFVPANWGLLLSGADLMAALTEVRQTSSSRAPGAKACVIDTGLRLQNNPGAGSDLLSQNTGRDDREHGTHVAGIVSSYAHGVNPALKTVVLTTPQMTEAELAQRLDEATANPDVGVINLSFAISDGPKLTSAIKRATEAGKWVVIAAGNRGVVNDPDAKGLPEVEDLPGVFIVGASSPAAGMPSHFSNHGPHVDFYAPGSQIESLNARANPGYIPAPGSVHQNGTSMAAPHATAVIATLRNLNPRLTSEEVKLILQETGIKRGPPPGITHLNPLLAAEAVLKMGTECPGISHGNQTYAGFRDCMEKAIQSVQAAETRVSGNLRDFSDSTCSQLETEYTRLRRAYFISRGGASESSKIIELLAPLGRPAPPSAAEILWFAPATPTSGDTPAIQAWTSDLTRQLNQARAIDPLSRDLIHALDVLAKYTAPPSPLTPSERLAGLPARQESVGTFIEICTPKQPSAQESTRYLAYPCSDFFQQAPSEFKEAFFWALESQIRVAESNNGVSPPFLEWVSTDDRWLSAIVRDHENEWKTPAPLLDHIVARPKQNPVPKADALFWIARLESSRTNPAPQGNPELNRAMIRIRSAGTPMMAAERLALKNDLRTIIAICKRESETCRSKVGGPGDGPGSNGPSIADQNIAKYQDALRQAVLSDPSFAKETAEWLAREDHLATFQTLFGPSSPLVPAILLAQRPDDINHSASLARRWLAAVEENIASGSYCAAGTMFCEPAAVLAAQMELIASTSPVHAGLIRDSLTAVQGTTLSRDSPLGRFRAELRIKIADSRELTSEEARRSLVQALQKKYQAPGGATEARSSALREEAGPLLSDPAIMPIYIDRIRSELGTVSSDPITNRSNEIIQTAMRLSANMAKPLIGDTLSALFARAAAGEEDYLGDITRHLGAITRDHAQDTEALQVWLNTLKKHQSGIDTATESKLFVTGAFELAQTEAGSQRMERDPAFLSEWSKAFKRSEISSYMLTMHTKHFPDVLARALATSLPGSEQLAKTDLESAENGWIKTLFQAGMSHEVLLDIALAAYGKCPEDSQTKTTFRQAIADGLRMHPSRVSALAGPDGILMSDPDLRHMIWGALETSGGSVP